DAVDRMERAFGMLSEDTPDEDLATLAAQLGRVHYFRGEQALSASRLETALEIAEELWLPEVMSQALNTKGILAQGRSRPQETYALTAHALKIALENDRSAAALRAYNNLAEAAYRMDRYEESLDLYERGLALADSIMVKIGFLEAIDAGFALGDLDRVRALTEWGEKLKSIRSSPAMMALHLRARARLAAAQGDDGADSLFDASTQTLRQKGNRF